MKFGFFSITLQKERQLTVKLKNKTEKRKFSLTCVLFDLHMLGKDLHLRSYKIENGLVDIVSN